MKKTSMIFTLFIFIVGCGGNSDTQNPPSVNLPDDSNAVIEPEIQDNDPEQQEPIVTPAEPEIEKEAEIAYRINQDNWKVEPIADANKKVVLITIDDAPDKHAVEMAQKLKDLDAPAIFFVNGHFLNSPEEEEMLKKIDEMGFAIGNHTSSHPYLNKLSDEEQRKEIINLSNRVEEIIGKRPVFFRAPHGVNTEFSNKLVKEEGMIRMNWSYGYDWEAKYQDAAALTDIMLNTPYLTSGSNLLMHDRAWTNEALEAIIEGLREEGYELVDPWTIETTKIPTQAVQP